jgi:hypothetical protein
MALAVVDDAVVVAVRGPFEDGIGARGQICVLIDIGPEAISPDGLIPNDGPTTALRMLSQFEKEIADKKIDLSKTYTNEFVLKANQKYK